MIVLKEGWPIKEFKQLPWNFGNFYDVNNVFIIKGQNNFSFENGSDKIEKITRVFVWSNNILVIDTNENFYYVCYSIPKKFIEKLKKQKPVDIMVENEYNGYTNHYKKQFKCQF